MQKETTIKKIGKHNIALHYDECSACGRLSSLGSYTTRRFITLFGIPLFPVGSSLRILNECTFCQHHVSTTNRKFKKQRKNDFAFIKKEFSKDPNDLQTALQCLHSLMVYDEIKWFEKCAKTYNSRFDSHPEIQLKIAEGLCRFGDYEKASIYCRKAIVLGAKDAGNELLHICQDRQLKKETGGLKTRTFLPQSMIRPYGCVFLMTLAIVLGSAAYINSILTTRPVWLVSGALTPYTVEIDGKPIRLMPYESKAIRLKIGDHSMQNEEGIGLITTTNFYCDATLRNKWIGQGGLVLNPDSMALIIKENRVNGLTSKKQTCGQTIYEFEHVDRLFRPFPKTNQTRPLVRIYNYHPVDKAEAIKLLTECRGSETSSQYAQRLLKINPKMPESYILLPLATRNMSTEETLAFFKFGTTNLPPLLNWHLMYQNFVITQKLNINLQSEYGTLFNKNPEYTEYAYLAGLVTTDLSIAKKYFELSEAKPGLNGYGYYQIAFDSLCSGRPVDATKYSKLALEKIPGDPLFTKIYHSSLLAREEYQPLLNLVNEALVKNSADGDAMKACVKYLTLIGHHKEVITAMNNFPDQDPKWLASFNAARFYAVGNINDYLKNLAITGDPNAPLQQALHSGDLKKAFELMNASATAKAIDWLILYNAAMYHNQTIIAKEAINRANTTFDQTSAQQLAAAEMLRSPSAPTINSVQQLRILPEEKAVLCTALGFRHPDQHEGFFKLAGLFNYTPEYPQLLIKKWTR